MQGVPLAEATPSGADARASVSEAGRRPSLFSASADDTVRIEPETSIMAALDGRLAKPQPVRPAWALWGGLGALAIAAGAAGWWWQLDNTAPAATPVARTTAATELKVAQAPVAVPAAEAASAVAPASAPADGASGPQARAVIEETSAGEPKSAAAPVPIAAAASAVAVADVAAPATLALAAAGTAVVATDAHSGKAAKAKDKPAAKPLATAPAKDRSKTPAKVATVVTEAKPASSAEAALRSQAPKDADVELLAALMHYSDEVNAPATGKARPQSGGARMNDLTIADLVKRCQALGGDEATQCKKRICSGYWGKAEACPAKQAPVSDKTKPKQKPA